MHRRCILPSLLVIVAMAASVVAAPSAVAADTEAARGSALTFGAALEGGDASRLRAILPARGKVQLRLQRLGPGRGDFSASQVEAVFRDFLKHGAVKGFEVFRVDEAPGGYALVRARAVVIDPSGQEGPVRVQLSLQPEGSRWVLTGVRELSR